VSWPVGTRLTPRNVARFRARAIRALYHSGAIGGCLVVHPYRDATGTGQYTEEGPHVHSIAIYPGDRVPVGTRGQVLKFLRTLPHERATARTLSYQLGHAGIAEGRHAITWWGAMNRRLVDPTDPDLAEPWGAGMPQAPMTCPACGAATVEYLAQGFCWMDNVPWEEWRLAGPPPAEEPPPWA